jgi:DNA-binding MarR family transcriptional regulator
VVLTVEGRSRVDQALDDLLAHEHAILAALTATDRERLADLLRRLTIPFDNAG